MNLQELQRTMAAAVMLPLTADEQMRETAGDGSCDDGSRGVVYCREQQAFRIRAPRDL